MSSRPKRRLQIIHGTPRRAVAIGFDSEDDADDLAEIAKWVREDSSIVVLAIDPNEIDIEHVRPTEAQT